MIDRNYKNENWDSGKTDQRRVIESAELSAQAASDIMRGFLDQRQRRGLVDFENSALIAWAIQHN